MTVTLSSRALVYDFFSDLFVYKWDDEEYESFMQRVKEMRDFPPLRELSEKLLSTPRRDLLVEYSSLFMANVGERLLNPAESKRLFSILGEKVALMKLRDLLSFYNDWGLSPIPTGFFQPEPDHVSSILAFMSFLIMKEEETKSQGREPVRSKSDQRTFFFNHILSWVPEWCRDVMKDKRADVFSVACRELVNWIEEERKVLGV